MRSLKEALEVIFSGHTAGQKMNYIRYRMSKKGELLRYGPVTISIVATSRCTLSCDMCPTHSAMVPDSYPHKQRNARDIDLPMCKDIMDTFESAMTVNIIGSGEPLLNRDFFQIVEYAAAKKMTVKTFSNGTTIASNTDRILDSKLDGITISINGHNGAEFKRMTGMPEERHRDICDAVGSLVRERDRRRSRVRVKVSHIIDKTNYRHMPQMARISLDLGADHTFFCNFLACPYGGLSAGERVLEASDEIAKEIRAMIDALPPAARKKFTFPSLIDRNAGAFRCDSHLSQMRFDGDGNISSCSMMLLDMTGRESRLGKDAWNNDFFRSMRRRFMSRDSSQLFEPCLWCPDNTGVHPWR